MKERIDAARTAPRRAARGLHPALAALLFSILNGVLALLLCADACAATIPPEALLAAYFRRPLLLALNILPAAALAALGYLLTDRAAAAYLLSAVPTLGGALVNYYKIQLRGDPFLAADLRLARTAGGVVGRYGLPVTPLIVCVLLCALLSLGVSLFLPRGGVGKTARLRGLLACLAVLPVLFSAGYLSDASYAATEPDVPAGTRSGAERYVSRGFWYSFLRSVPDALPSVPGSFSARSARALLSRYPDADIPETQKIQVVGVMLEAFCDLTDFPMLAEQAGVAAVYEPLHELESRGVSGDLLTNIFSGGTVDTEWGFLSGYSRHNDFIADVDSYVRYFKSQGYETVFHHPGYSWFYDRAAVNGHLGFDKSVFTENGFGALVDPTFAPYRSDAVLFDYLLDELAGRTAEDAPLFSFSVSYQNHGPYGSDPFDGAAVTPETSGWSAESCAILSHYLYGVGDTVTELCRFVDALDALDTPVALVVFGDHKPWLGNDKAVYRELGVNLALDTEEGFRNVFSTPYLLWANRAAEQALGRRFSGGGNDVSPCFLMAELFDRCGWDGPAFMQLAREMRALSPVLHDRGLFLSDGVLSTEETLRADVRSFYLDYRGAEYWRETGGLG